MIISKYLVILFTFYSTLLLADSTCLECLEQRSKYIEGRPTSGALESLERTAKKVTSKVAPKEEYQQRFCTQFEISEDTVDVETMFEDMEASPYEKNISGFWTTSSCRASLFSKAPVPIIFNTANDTVKNEEFPTVVHDYFVKGKKSPEVWLKAINTTNSEGYTFLDYLQYNIDRGYYKGTGTKDAALRIVSYLCRNGGVYSKLKNTARCN